MSKNNPNHNSENTGLPPQIKASSSKMKWDVADYKITPTADFSEKDLTNFLRMLLDKKLEILERSKARIDGGDIVIDHNEMTDQMDLATMSVEQNVIFKLLDRDRLLLAEIDRAIAKVSSGDYGYCEGSGDAIPHKRLELNPWTRFSVRYKEQLESSKARYAR